MNSKPATKNNRSELSSGQKSSLYHVKKPKYLQDINIHHLECIWHILTISKTESQHLSYLCPASLRVISEVSGIRAVRYNVLFHPVIGVVSSLSGNSCHPKNCHEIDLKPLVHIVGAWSPGVDTVQPTVPGRVVRVVIRRCCELTVGKALVLEAKRKEAAACESKWQAKFYLALISVPPQRTCLSGCKRVNDWLK